MSAEQFKVLDKGWSKVRGSMQGLRDSGKSYAILRVAKVKAMGNLAASLQHTFRERETLNADGARLKDNTVLLGADNSTGVIEAWKDRAPDKIRSNAVHGLEYFVGGSPARLNAMTRDEQDAYFKDALDWIKEERGADNVLSAVIHRDETTPHMSVMTIPLDANDRLNARAIVGNKGHLSRMQSDFAAKISEQHGLVRGVKGSTARHERVRRVYGGALGLDKPVALPERERGALLGVGKETDKDWHLRATLAATDAVGRSELRREADMRDAEGKLQFAADTVDHISALAQAAKIQADVASCELARIKASLEIAGMGDQANAALAVFDKMAERIVAGDLTLIKEAAHSGEQLDAIIAVYDIAVPAGSPMNPDQALFNRSLKSTVDAVDEAGRFSEDPPVQVALAKPALPYCEKLLDHVRAEKGGSPFTNAKDVLSFRAEVESTLPMSFLEALWEGKSTGILQLFAQEITSQEQFRIALAYLDDAGIDPNSQARVGLLKNMSDDAWENRSERLVDQEPGLRH